MAPSDSDRDCPSRRDSDPPVHHGPAGHPPLQQPPRLGITAPSADSESGGSHSPSPRASRRRTKVRSHSLTSLCLLSHHPFFSTFRECLFILKKLINACNESSSPKSVGGSRQSGRLVLHVQHILEIILTMTKILATMFGLFSRANQMSKHPP